MSKLDHKQQETPPASLHVGMMTVNGEAAIWPRLIQPERDDLSEAAARSILRIEFAEQDKTRMHKLALKAQEESLTESDQAGIDNDCRVGRLLDLMHSKARRSLQRPEF